MFKAYKVEVENQQNKKIKHGRSNCDGKYHGRYDESGEQSLEPFLNS